MTVGTVLLRPISFTAARGRQVCSARAMGTKAASKVNLAAVIQLTCTADKAANYSRASSLVSEAASRGAEVAFLPEAFDFIGENRQQVRELSEPLDGPTVTAYRDLAKFHGISLSLGGLHESCGDSEEKIRNTHLLIDSFGNILTTYSKVHLFDVEIPGKFRLRESDHASPGNRIEPPARLPYSDLSIGLGICYDLRFPELAASLARRGADVLTFPSAFTVATGLAHWETLLRARAIETQCYVVAAAQTGKHNDKRSSYGHSVIVDPWGTVVAQCAEGEGLAIAEINRDYLQTVRQNMPVGSHRRTDLYGLGIKDDLEDIDDTASFKFGTKATISGSSLVFQTRLSFVSVNRKPVLPGHLLVIPKRDSAQRMADLDAEEMCDLFIAVQFAQRVVERHFGAGSSTVTVQDGREAGQTVEHVHVHILPRKEGDFQKNDDVYQALDKHDKVEGGWRTNEAMAEEAKGIRKSVEELRREKNKNS